MRIYIIKKVKYYGRSGYGAFSLGSHLPIGIIIFTEDSGAALQIYSFQVLNEYQRNGIGRKLLSCVVDYSLRKGIHKIYVAPAPCSDLEPSNCCTNIIKKIYCHFGFVAESTNYGICDNCFYILKI